MGDFGPGSVVILVDEKRGKRHMTKLKEGVKFTTQYGKIDHEDIMAANDGAMIYTSTEVGYRVFKPTYIDYVMNIKRKAQIVYPKDAAAIVMWGDIHPGLNVLESGIGQGALTMTILRALGGQGHLTTYEIREDFAEQADNYISEFYGHAENHVVEIRDIYESVDGLYDRIILDVPEPWHVVKHSEHCLKDGGIMIAYIPTILQVKEHVDTLRACGYFEEIETFELNLRPWKVEGRSVRPEMWVYSHSAFLVAARKVEAVENRDIEIVDEEEPDDGGPDECCGDGCCG